MAESVGRGLRMIGQEADKPLCIFADTRAEWMLCAQACFKQSFPVVTLYTNLGVEAVVHGLNETKVDTVITSHELLPKFKQILKDTPYVKKIIYFENQIKETDTTGYKGTILLKT
jgi:long-chain acyl-CoA synthetase